MGYKWDVTVIPSSSSVINIDTTQESTFIDPPRSISPVAIAEPEVKPLSYESIRMPERPDSRARKINAPVGHGAIWCRDKLPRGKRTRRGATKTKYETVVQIDLRKSLSKLKRDKKLEPPPLERLDQSEDRSVERTDRSDRDFYSPRIIVGR